MPHPEVVSRLGELVRDGGPFVIVAVVLAGLFLGVCYAIYRFIAKPAMTLGVSANTAAAAAGESSKTAAESAKTAASEARLAADASREAINIAKTMQDGNAEMFKSLQEVNKEMLKSLLTIQTRPNH